MKKFLLTALSTFSFAYAVEDSENILTLLKKYEESSDLSKKTKRESLGHLIVFTRKDLEIMQANYLSDVLRLVPLSNYAPNKFGVESLTNAGENYKISTKYRLYINDHEVSSISTYSPFLTYDRYPLDHIDHIEIYIAPGAISVSNEPSQMIIKLYTKRPERENASVVKGLVDSRKSYLLSFFSAKKVNSRLSYLVFLNKSEIDFKDLLVGTNHISKDQERSHLFFQINYKDWMIDTSFSYVERKPFFGFSSDGSPDKGYIHSLVGYVSATKTFLEDKSLKLILSYDYQHRDIEEANKSSEGGVYYTSYRAYPPPTYINEKKPMHKFAVSVEKEWKEDNNELLIGTFARYYKQNVDKFEVSFNDSTITKDEKDSPLYNVVKYFWIYSLYVENKHNINDKNLFILGVRLDDYKFEGNSAKQDVNARIGFISYIKNNWMAKGFITEGYILPSMLAIEANKDKKLNSTKFISYTLETTYSLNDKHQFTLFLFSSEIECYPVYNTTLRSLENSKDTYTVYSVAGRYILNINSSNKIEIYGWYLKGEGGIDGYYSPNKGGYIRTLTDYKGWKLYNQLIYKGSYSAYGKTAKASFDYTVAVSKELKNDWKINLKAENIFNSSEKVIYKPIAGSPVVYEGFDRRFLISIEKVF